MITKNKITDVTVYLSGAQITRQARLEPSAGVSELIFENLTYTLQPESLQVSVAGNDNVAILSVEHKINYLKQADKSGEIEALQSELKTLTEQITAQQSELLLCDFEQSFFEKNSDLAGSETGLKANDLKEAVLFYNERMAENVKKRIGYNKTIEELQDKINMINYQLGSFGNTQQIPVSEVVVKINAKTSEPANLRLSYYVPSAAWQPSYDIRAKDVSNPVLLHYKATVSQNTNESWENVKLTLSTGNPSINGKCPDLKPWYIDFYTEPQMNQFQQFNAVPMMERSLEKKAVEMIDCYETNELSIVPEPSAVVNESLTCVEYAINELYSIKSGDGGQNVDIITHSLPATYHYFSIRKMEKEVFLLAAVRDWEHLNLIAGEASIFFENCYVGKTFIDPRQANEEINLSLGVDKTVMVTRVKGKDFTEKNLTGSSVKQTRQWELTIRNLKDTPIEIKVLDQIPVSLNKQITVDAVEISGAELNKDNGILTWELTMEPTSVRKIPVKYIVTQPKNTTVVLD